MKFLSLTILSITALLIMLSFPLLITANSSTQNTTTSDSEVVITDQNGIKFATTQIESPAPTVSPQPEVTPNPTAKPRPRTRQISSFFGPVNVPEGFISDWVPLINRSLRVVLAAAALLTFAYLIWGGLRWITSGGDKGKVEDARNSIISAIVGLVVVASSYAILLLALQFIGYNSLEEVLEEASGRDITITNETTN